MGICQGNFIWKCTSNERTICDTVINRVEVSKRAERSLAKVPRQVAAKFFYWSQQIEEHGLDVVKTIPGYHDEPLKGKLKGVVRSVRLALGYRAYYRVSEKLIKCVLVEEVNRHDYKEIERLFSL
jgi:proteic killer suppression protein